MVRKGQIVAINWNRIARLHSHVLTHMNSKSRTQSLQAFWSAGQRREDSGDIKFYHRRISAVNNGNRYGTPQDFCGKTMETVTEQPIKKIEFF